MGDPGQKAGPALLLPLTSVLEGHFSLSFQRLSYEIGLTGPAPKLRVTCCCHLGGYSLKWTPEREQQSEAGGRMVAAMVQM